MERKDNVRFLATVGLFTVGLHATSAQAQSAPTDRSTERQPSERTEVNASLGEIIVTARRKEENLQDVPVAIAAFSQADLEARQINDAQKLTQSVPSLLVGASGTSGTNFTIRGQGATYYAGPGVVAYFAEVPLPTRGVTPGVYYDLQNLQVLKGPQGTLFGRNTTGGAVLFEPKRPTNEFEGYVQAVIGSYDRRQIEGALNVPIIDDKFMVRVAGDIQKRDGYVKDVNTGRDYDNVDYWSVRLGITVKPTDNLENYTLFTALDNRTHGAGAVLEAVAPTLRPLLQSTLDAQIARGRYRVALGPTIPHTREKSWTVINNTRWTVSDELVVRNIVSYSETKTVLNEDTDASPFPLLEVAVPTGYEKMYRTFTEEFQLQGQTFGKALEWTVGAYFERVKPFDRARNQWALTVFGNDARGVEYQDRKSYAFYGQATLDFGSFVNGLEGLKFTGGLRHTWDRSSIVNTAALDAFGICFGASDTPYPNCSAGGFTKSDRTTYTLALNYQLNRDVLLYVTSRRGYKQGGINPLAPAALKSFAPELVTDYEVGAKTTLSLGAAQLRLNGAAYKIDYSDVQKVVATPQGTAATLNAAKARVKGVELDANVAYGPVSLTAAYAYTDGKFKNFINPLTNEDLSNTGYPLIAKHAVNVSGRLALPAPESLGEFALVPAFIYQSKVRIQQAGLPAPGDDIPGRKLVNLTLEFDKLGGTGLGGSLLVTNVFDKQYRTSAFTAYNTIGYSFSYIGEPRMYGIKLRYRF